MNTTTAAPALGSTITFVAHDGELFTGTVVKSYGFAVSVSDALTGRVVPMEIGVEYAAV